MDSLILEPGAQAGGLGMGPLGTERVGTRSVCDVERGVARQDGAGGFRSGCCCSCARRPFPWGDQVMTGAGLCPSDGGQCPWDPWSRSHSSLQGRLTPLFQEALGNAPKSCDISGKDSCPSLISGAT